MNRDIQLYIDGHLIEWNDVPNIQFTYQTTDYTNPTVVKNNFSKTVNVDGTPTNNKIFSEIWHLDRVMDGTYSLFNPSQKVPFEVYRNDEIVEKGYAKLDSIDREGYKVGYNITLYGGLGSFFYALDYDINSDKQKSLADLDFMGTNTPDDEFTFEINKNRVYDAWSRLGHTGNTGSWAKWNYINFAPCYNGYPENFDTSKVIMNTHGLSGMAVRWTNDEGVQYSTFPQSITNNGTAFTPYNGYIYGDLNKDLTEWETRDLRSYLQRPVMSIKGLFDAIKRPQNNGGYTVNLDPDFFSDDNPYYSKAWVTLPLLDTDTDAIEEMEGWSFTLQNKTDDGGETQIIYRYKVVSDGTISRTPDTFEMNVKLFADFEGVNLPDTLYMWADADDWNIIRNAIVVQMYGNRTSGMENADAICGSNKMVFTTRNGNDFITTNVVNYLTHVPFQDSTVQYVFGTWQKVSGNHYKWVDEEGNDTFKIIMDTNNVNFVPLVGLCFNTVSNIFYFNGNAFNSMYYADRVSAMQGSRRYGDSAIVSDEGSHIMFNRKGAIRSYQNITKKMLLGGMNVTPCDWLLGYCKIFGLFIYKDKTKDIIYIRMRNNFYNNEIVDIEDAIDIGKEMKITPLTFDSKWYTFNYTENNGKFLDSYKKLYNQDFGKQLVDTKYNFDSEDVDILEGIVYKNGITALEKSNYFNNKYDTKGFRIPPVLYDWVKFTYYSSDNTYETNMTLPQGTSIEYINSYMDEQYYDVIPKLQLHDSENKGTDGEGIFVFFNGAKNTNKVNYWITDDLDEMYRESQNPCWLATEHEWNQDWSERIAIKVQTLPSFDRYVLHQQPQYGKTPVITCAWDFGRTKELFVPYYRYDVDKTPTIYENFWQRYINDLYSVDTRKVDAYVNLDTNSVYDALKRFYWFHNCLWVMTKVENYDICLDRATKCSFTKVNDLNSYLHDVTFDDYYFNFYRVNGSGNVPWSGTTDELTVDFMVDSSSDWYVMTGDYTIATMVDSYSVNATSGTAGNSIPVQAVFTPNQTNNPRTVIFYGVNLETNQVIQIPVTQDAWVNSSHLFLSTSIYYIPQTTTNMTFMVLVYSSDPWTCSYEADWVHSTVDSGAAGDYTTWSFTCDNNYTGEERRTEVWFTNGTDNASFIIWQKEKSKGTVEQKEDSARYTVPSTGGSINYEVVCDTDWTLLPSGSCSSYTSCVDFSVSHTATTGYTTSVVVSANNSTVSRNVFFYLSYDGNIQKPTVVQLPLSQNGSGNTVLNVKADFTGDTIDLNAQMPWKAYTYENWISVTPTSGGSGDTRIEYTLTANTGIYRIGYIYVEYTDEYGYPCTEVFEIQQEGSVNEFEVSPTAMTIPYRGGTYMVNVTASSPFTASTNNSWIEIPSNRPLTSVPFDVEENSGATARLGYVNFTNGVATAQTEVIQAASTTDRLILIKPSSVSYSKTGGTGSLTVYCTEDWALETNDSWITLNANSGNGNTIIPYTVDANDGLDRVGSISGYVVSHQDHSATTVVRQEANRYLYSEGYVSMPLASSTTQISVTSNVDWVAETEDSWITVSPSSGSGNGTLTITTASGSSPRNGSIVLSNDVYGFTFEIIVIQEQGDTITYVSDRKAESHSGYYAYNANGDRLTLVSHNWDSGTGIGTIVYNGNVVEYGCTGNYDSDSSCNVPIAPIRILSSWTFPSTVKVVGSECFYHINTGQTPELNFGGNVEKFGQRALARLGFEEINIPEGVTGLCLSCCMMCTASKVTLPSTLQRIGRDCFYSCSNLSTIYCYASTCPILPSASYANPFNGVSETGTLHYPNGSDYSTMIAKLPSGWTAVADL